jgi:hypothetical protein
MVETADMNDMVRIYSIPPVLKRFGKISSKHPTAVNFYMT